jgi:hypothetical protein
VASLKRSSRAAQLFVGVSAESSFRMGAQASLMSWV